MPAHTDWPSQKNDQVFLFFGKMFQDIGITKPTNLTMGRKLWPLIPFSEFIGIDKGRALFDGVEKLRF